MSYTLRAKERTNCIPEPLFRVAFLSYRTLYRLPIVEGGTAIPHHARARGWHLLRHDPPDSSQLQSQTPVPDQDHTLPTRRSVCKADGNNVNTKDLRQDPPRSHKLFLEFGR